MTFPTEYNLILSRLKDFDPSQYGSSRNYIDGAVSYLSPYISRGVLSTKQIYLHIKTLDLPWYKAEKFIQELAWREYWQQVWIAKGNGIFLDIKQKQEPIITKDLPQCIINANSGISAIDTGITLLKETGYMHNHMRMYVASLFTNIAQTHWLQPAKWMYSHLLDGDIASNHLSWQWVAGAFSSKKYYANQENINKYFKDNQSNTFLDVEYDQFPTLTPPQHLLETKPFDIKTNLPKAKILRLEQDKPTLIYNYYNLDPLWHNNENCQRILLIEPSVFSQYPVDNKCINFMLELSQNIPGIQLFVGEYDELLTHVKPENIRFKEHPLNKHYKGKEESRDWMSSVTGYFPSFFAYWKKSKKELNWINEH